MTYGKDVKAFRFLCAVFSTAVKMFLRGTVYKYQDKCYDYDSFAADPTRLRHEI